MALFSRNKRPPNASGLDRGLPHELDAVRLGPVDLGQDMPDRAPDRRDDSAAFAGLTMPTVLAAGATIKGALFSDKEIQIDGRVEGQVTAPRVSVSAGGSVKGSIKAKEILFAGSLDGKLDGDKVTVFKTATLKGEVLHGKLALEPGAELDAKLTSRKAAKPDQTKPGAGKISPEPKEPKAASQLKPQLEQSSTDVEKKTKDQVQKIKSKSV